MNLISQIHHVINRIKNTISLNDRIKMWVAFYFVTHFGLLLISNAIYWDDWILFQGQPGVVIDTFIQQAATLFYLEGYLHVFLLKVGPWIYKLATFFLMLMTGFFVNEILKRHSFFGEDLRFFIVLFFLIFPFNTARVALIDFRYTVCYFCFFYAWYLMDKRKYVSAVLFFISFNTQSLLVFYALPVVELFFLGRHHQSMPLLRKFICRDILFLIIPFAFFFAKVIVFPSSGLYLDYNRQYSLSNLFSSPVQQFWNIFEFNIRPLHWAVIFFLTLVAAYLLRGPMNGALTEKTKKGSLVLIAVGLFAFVLGAFPYWILGHVPTFNEWTSRHQLLLPLGFSLTFVGASLFFFSNSIAKWIFSLALGFSLWINVTNYVRLFIDWEKQKTLITLIANNEAIKKSKLIVFDDSTKSLNALDRGYRDYEWNGLVKAAFGDEKRYCVDSSKWSKKEGLKSDRLINKYYLATDFDQDTFSNPLYVKIERGSFKGLDFWQKFFFSPTEAFVLRTKSDMGRKYTN
jgi:hypothetical protein